MQRIASWLVVIARVVVIGCFAVVPRWFWDVEVRGLEHDEGKPRTYLAISHKRDLDAILPLATILFHRGWRALAGDVRFAMRADGFTRAFLSRIVMRPRWFSWLIRPLSVGPILRRAGTQPLQGLRNRPIEEWIREQLRVEGDPRAGEVLTPALLEEVARATNQAPEHIAARPLSHLLAWRYQHAIQRFSGPEILLPLARRRAERRLLGAVKQQIADLAAWLWSGGSLYGSPEGQLSPSGVLSPITGGWHRLLRAGSPETRVVPIFVMYDFMTVRRPCIFIDIAPAIKDAPRLPPTELNRQLRQAWLRHARFTCTQLASGFLVRAGQSVSPFTLDDLARAIGREAVTLAASRRHVDWRLLQPRRARKLAAGFLAYCRRRKLVRRTEDGAWMPTIGSLTVTARLGEVGYLDTPLAYAWNELQEMLALELAPAAPLPGRATTDG